LKNFYLFICFVFLLFNARSQFTYINVSGGYEGLSLNKTAFGGSTLNGLKRIFKSLVKLSEQVFTQNSIEQGEIKTYGRLIKKG